MVMHDITTQPCKADCERAHAHVARKPPSVERIVRPHNRYGAAVAGDRVRLDASEAKHPAARAALMTDAEAEALAAAEKAARAKVERPKSNPVNDAIRAQLERAWADGAKRRTAG